MTFEDYEKTITKLAIELIPVRLSVMEFLEERLETPDDTLKSCIDFRKMLLDKNDRQRVAGLLECGFFKNLTPIDRETCFQISLEIEWKQGLIDVTRDCAKYESNQPLFKGAPHLFDAIRKKRITGKLGLVEIHRELMIAAAR